MLSLDPLYPEFVSGPKSGIGRFFFCKVCRRDVSMATRGATEFKRHVGSEGHWVRDVTYRVHMGIPIYNSLMERTELTAEQRTEYSVRPIEDLAEGYPFLEDLLPKYSKVDSKVPFMTLSSSLCDVLRSGGDFDLVRRLWSHFCVALGTREPEFKLNWSRSETLFSCSFVRFIITSDFDGLFDSCYCIVVFFFFLDLS